MKRWQPPMARGICPKDFCAFYPKVTRSWNYPSWSRRLQSKNLKKYKACSALRGRSLLLNKKGKISVCLTLCSRWLHHTNHRYKKRFLRSILLVFPTVSRVLSQNWSLEFVEWRSKKKNIWNFTKSTKFFAKNWKESNKRTFSYDIFEFNFL